MSTSTSETNVPFAVEDYFETEREVARLKAQLKIETEKLRIKTPAFKSFVISSPAQQFRVTDNEAQWGEPRTYRVGPEARYRAVTRSRHHDSLINFFKSIAVQEGTNIAELAEACTNFVWKHREKVNNPTKLMCERPKTGKRRRHD